MPPGVFTHADRIQSPGLVRRWRQTQLLVNAFWKRFQKEYLTTLHLRSKWRAEKKDFAVNDLVIVGEPNMPRSQWVLGRILRVYPGRDGRIRSVTVRTSTSTLDRPITKICLLEASTWCRYYRVFRISLIITGCFEYVCREIMFATVGLVCWRRFPPLFEFIINRAYKWHCI